MRISSDGLVHLSIDELLSMPLKHLVSGLDVEHRIGQTDCGQETDISGYTEWISSTVPAISIGWDWRIQSTAGPLQWERVGAPRSNVMLMFTAGDDAGWDRNLEILSTVVDALPWRDEVPQAVATRYA